MRKVHMAVLGCIVAMSMVLAGMAGAGDMAVQVKQTCTACHTLKRVCSKLGKRDAAAWTMTLKVMIANGADLAKADVEPFAEFLGGLEKNDSSLCE